MAVPSLGYWTISSPGSRKQLCQVKMHLRCLIYEVAPTKCEIPFGGSLAEGTLTLCSDLRSKAELWDKSNVLDTWTERLKNRHTQ